MLDCKNHVSKNTVCIQSGIVPCIVAAAHYEVGGGCSGGQVVNKKSLAIHCFEPAIYGWEGVWRGERRAQPFAIYVMLLLLEQ